MVADVEAKALIKERQKKDNHNLSEYYSVATPEHTRPLAGFAGFGRGPVRRSVYDVAKTEFRCLRAHSG